MIDRHYFEEILPDQVRGFKQPVSVQVTTDTGRTYEAYRLFAVHEEYVILDVYPEYGAEPMRLPGGMGGEAGPPQITMDQVVLPYARVAAVYFNSRTEKHSAIKPVGFQVAGPKRSK